MAKTETKPYVRIQSSMNIRVTSGLQCQDVTNPDAHVPDRLKVNPLWPKLTAFIKQGAGVYPSEIAEWATVKALAKDGVLTVGEFLDSAEPDVVAQKEELATKIEAAKAKMEEAKRKSLSDIAED